MWLTGLIAPRHVGSSQTSARTRVPCIGRRILNHRATREALFCEFLFHPPGKIFLTSRVLLSILWPRTLLCLCTNTREKETGEERGRCTSGIHRDHRAPATAFHVIEPAQDKAAFHKVFSEERFSSAEVIRLIFFSLLEKHFKTH